MSDTGVQLDRWVADECEELSSSTSVTLQSAMVRGWEKVLRRRAVARLGAARSSRSRAFRRSRMTARRDLVLREKGGVPSVSAGTTSDLVISSHSFVASLSESEGDSEDEPLVRRIPSGGTFRPS